MSPTSRRISRAFGRSAFGGDPELYDRSRPDYPDWIYERLEARCGLGPGCRAFEIGSGTGVATRALLAAGARVVALEPDPRLAEFLRRRTPSPALDVRNQTFEDAALEPAAFDIGLAATSFHWLAEGRALTKAAALLRVGGWLALLWNVFGDDSRADPFHVATKALLADGPRSPSGGGKGGVPFALAVNDRMSALGRSGAFEAAGYEAATWDLALDPDGVVALYSTYSDITSRPEDERRRVLAELRRIAARDFAGHVVRNMTTILYTARKAPVARR